jgi:general secretion pathway protein M
MSLHTTLSPLVARWRQLPLREKRLLTLATSLVLAAALWLLVLAPALATLRSADAQARSLDAQLERMRAMQALALALQKQAPMGWDESLKALTQATQQSLGNSAQVAVTGDRANVTLQGVSADALARWLVQARVNARSVPLEARLARVVGGKTPQDATWNGTLLMSLPAR